MPYFPTHYKFYYLPFRLFEFCFGAIIVEKYREVSFSDKAIKLLKIFAVVTIILLLIINSNFVNTEIRLFAVVIMTSVIILTSKCIGYGKKCIFLEHIGMTSYSIFIWHQVIIAFYRYFFSNKISIGYAVGYFAIVLLLSEASFKIIECNTKQYQKSIMSASFTIAIITTACAVLIFFHAGVVRDVPELGIKMNDVHRGMNKEYTDRIYSMDKDFDDNGKINVLIVGNSFARDMANILMESSWADKLNISYSFSFTKDLLSRVNKSDYVLAFLYKDEIPKFVYDKID